jgi:hypothetical protein
MEVSGQPHPPAASPLGKEPLYSLNRKLGGTQAVWRSEKCLACAGIQISGFVARSVVAILTTLYRLQTMA